MVVGLETPVKELDEAMMSRPLPLLLSPPAPLIEPPVNVSVPLLVMVIEPGVTPAAWMVTTEPLEGLLKVTLSPCPLVCE